MKNRKNHSGTRSQSEEEKKVSKKKDERESKEEFPGYPHYLQDEDMLSPASHTERVDADVEKMPRSESGRKNDLEKLPPVQEASADFTPDIVLGNEADLTNDDLVALGEKDMHMDGGEDQTILPRIQEGPDHTGEDLDVPGAELDDDSE